MTSLTYYEMRTLRTASSSASSAALSWVFVKGFIGNLGTIALASLDYSPTMPLAAMVLLTVVYVIVAGFAQMDNIKAAAEDMDEDEKKTAMGKRLMEIPYGLFKSLTALLFGLCAIAQFYVLFG
jgi:hypothetical protein